MLQIKKDLETVNNDLKQFIWFTDLLIWEILANISFILFGPSVPKHHSKLCPKTCLLPQHISSSSIQLSHKSETRISWATQNQILTLNYLKNP